MLGIVADTSNSGLYKRLDSSIMEASQISSNLRNGSQQSLTEESKAPV